MGKDFFKENLNNKNFRSIAFQTFAVYLHTYLPTPTPHPQKTAFIDIVLQFVFLTPPFIYLQASLARSGVPC
jgi:hypothetical protein